MPIGQAQELLASALSKQEIAQLDKLVKKVRDNALERLGQKVERLPESFDGERFEGGVVWVYLDTRMPVAMNGHDIGAPTQSRTNFESRTRSTVDLEWLPRAGFAVEICHTHTIAT